MSAFKNFIYNNKRGLTFIFFMILSLILLFFSNKKVTIAIDFKKIIFTFTSPFQFMITGTGNFFRDTVNSISELNKIKNELDKTRMELEQYKKALLDFNEINRELKELKNILDLKNNIEYEIITCEVIGRDPRKLNDFLIINKGSTKGIKENMPVISYLEGKKVLVGKTVEVTPFYSKVMTLNHSKFNAGAIISNERLHCIASGDNVKQDIIKLLYIPKSYNLPKDEITYIYTSGDSLIYPKGIEIGKIISLKESQRYENFNEAYVKISVNLSKLEYVIVLKVEKSLQNLDMGNY